MMGLKKLSHLDEQGRAKMVDVGSKVDSDRMAIATGEVYLSSETVEIVRAGTLKKGDVFNTAELAGVMAAKRTSELIPLCHNLPLNDVAVELTCDDDLPGIRIYARVKSHGKTGVEMEALTAVSVAALTIVDMVKSVERKWVISNIRLVEKHGGRSGDVYPWEEPS